MSCSHFWIWGGGCTSVRDGGELYQDRQKRSVAQSFTCTRHSASKRQLDGVSFTEVEDLADGLLEAPLPVCPRLHSNLVGDAIVDNGHNWGGLGHVSMCFSPVRELCLAEAAHTLLAAGKWDGSWR